MNEILTVHPKKYEDAKLVAETFRDGIPVVMNLTQMSESEARRMVDFASGLTQGLYGHIERVTPKVFLLSPSHIQVSGDAAEDVADDALLDLTLAHSSRPVVSRRKLLGSFPGLSGNNGEYGVCDCLGGLRRPLCPFSSRCGCASSSTGCRLFSRNWRPKGPVLLLAEASYSLTDKPLRSVRRVIPPLRLGGAAIDFGWAILMVGTLIVMSIVGGFR